MDIRGIEVTNQLRSAIRAKLLELGVKYDEELPDYILVMVVNKKTRHQMHEDLHLFLEDSTTPFVDWLHDQVLKKLQKVTIAKKKPREFVPAIVVKQEEKKKRKFSEIEEQKIKEEPSSSSVPRSTTPIEPKSNQQTEEKVVDESIYSRFDINDSQNDSLDPSKENTPERTPKEGNKQPERSDNLISKTVFSKSTNELADKTPSAFSSVGITSMKASSTLASSEVKKNEASEDDSNHHKSPPVQRRLKSLVNKPKITSVVSIKSRLGITIRDKFQMDKNYLNNENHRKQLEKRDDRYSHDYLNRRNHFQGKGSVDDVSLKRSPKNGVKSHHTKMPTSSSANSHSNSNISDNHSNSNSNKRKLSESDDIPIKSQIAKHSFPSLSSSTSSSSNIKSRLGIVSNKLKETAENDQRSIKNRLGPVKSKFIALGRLGISSNNPDRSADDTSSKIDNEIKRNNYSTLKSRIIAVNKSNDAKIDRKHPNKPSTPNDFDGAGDEEKEGEDKQKADIEKEKKVMKEEEKVNEGEDARVIASKVIVTPRPLKPLQPHQKRATQSLLLRAVAEANQSVVQQKNPEPVLVDNKLQNKSALKRLEGRKISDNLAVRLNANKRLVMEKIQVELTTSNDNHTSKFDEPEPYVPKAITDEQIDVMMSLFQKGDDSQKFLVTLNGYNNNVSKNYTNDEERLEIEDNEELEEEEEMVEEEEEEDEEFQDLTNEETVVTELGESFDKTEINDDDSKNIQDDYENDSEILKEVPQKRRKLSPIVYNRSSSPIPKPTKQLVTNIEKKTYVNPSQIVDKSLKKCRYWPNCTLGSKCTYFHPPVLCSAFPACKFGDKCSYKHPKCKFGLSCTKLVCVFSHPLQQCKYYPYCVKTNCPYSHPKDKSLSSSTSSSSSSSTAAFSADKFTWRKHE